MHSLPDEPDGVSPVLTAATLLLALPLLRDLGLPHPTAEAVLAATGVSRSRAYELRNALQAGLPALLRPPGRPPAPEIPPPDTRDLVRAARNFAYDHPGAVSGAGARQRYSDAFRYFVLDLAAQHRDVPLVALADAIGMPLPTLKDWLEGGVAQARPPDTLASARDPDPTQPQVETLLSLWDSWEGSFSAFCTYAQHDWRLPFGRTLIGSLLDVHGVRHAKRRTGRSPDEDALRGKFVTFFPNAQWVGDGSPIALTVGPETFTFNVQLMVDPCSGAVTGASVRDTEDGAAVVESFDDGVATTGAAPLAVLLDNKPSNHAPAVQEALGDTQIVRATPYRPQNKAHVEGGFGLFRQVAPALVVALVSPREIARQVLEMIVTTWARTLNHKPRGDRLGRSRVELHLDHVPTASEVAVAREALAERLRRQELARQTRAARQDPLVRETLTAAFGRLHFDDPEGTLLTGIARYPLDAVLAGIGIVEGKRRAGTLPPGVDARYLLGVVRNVSHEEEGVQVALALWEERRRARDSALDVARAHLDRLEEVVDDPHRRVVAYVDRAMLSTRRLDRFFWLTAIVDCVTEDDDASVLEPLFRLAARRIHATHAVPHRERLAATRFLAARILPID